MSVGLANPDLDIQRYNHYLMFVFCEHVHTMAYVREVREQLGGVGWGGQFSPFPMWGSNSGQLT